MPEAAPPIPVFRTASLSDRKPTRFRFLADAATRSRMARVLDIPEVRHLRFEGDITPSGRHDFHLTALLQAEVVQACVVTLAPVRAVLRETVSRKYCTDLAPPDAEEVEMLDDTQEPLPESLDIFEIACEALALALPDYPRAPGAALGETVFAPPGTAALKAQDLKPFAGLAALKARLSETETEEGPDSEG